MGAECCEKEGKPAGDGGGGEGGVGGGRDETRGRGEK